MAPRTEQVQTKDHWWSPTEIGSSSGQPGRPHPRLQVLLGPGMLGRRPMPPPHTPEDNDGPHTNRSKEGIGQDQRPLALTPTIKNTNLLVVNQHLTCSHYTLVFHCAEGFFFYSEKVLISKLITYSKNAKGQDEAVP